ncbi:unnamed protein product, partial [Brassica oleracea]
SPDSIKTYFNLIFNTIAPLFHLSSIQSTSSSPIITDGSSEYKSPISSDEQHRINQIKKNSCCHPTSSFLIGA